jgi:hypothetical protein
VQDVRLITVAGLVKGRAGTMSSIPPTSASRQVDPVNTHRHDLIHAGFPN